MTGTKILIGQIMVVFALIIGAVWLATQMTADTLGHQAALGAPWFIAGETPIYKPWRLFQWWYAYEAYAPEVFARGGLIAVSGSALGFLAAIIGSVLRSRHERHVTTYGSARWASAPDLKRAGLFADKGVFLGRGKSAICVMTALNMSWRLHQRVQARAWGWLYNLLSWTGSAVIHDIKGENWELTSGWRSGFSRCVRFDPTDRRSRKYNPLMGVRRGEHEVRDVQNIADILVDPEGSLERRNHWEKTGHALLVGVILHVLYAEADKTLSGCVRFLSDPKRSFAVTLRIMMTTPHLGREGCIR